MTVTSQERKTPLEDTRRLRERRTFWLGAILLATVVAIPYANSLGNGFVWDDNIQLRFDPPSKIDWVEILTGPSWLQTQEGVRVIESKEIITYRPLLILSFTLDAYLWGDNAAGWHLSNLLWFGGLGFLLYTVAVGLGLSVGAALVLTSLYVTQGILTESVSWISGRHDIMMATALAASLAALIRGSRSNGLSRVGFVLGSFITFVLALLCKEPACLYPLVLLGLMQCAPLRNRFTPTARLLIPALFLVTAGVYLLFRAQIVARGNLVGGGEGVVDVVASAPFSLLKFLGYFFYTPHLTSHFHQSLIRGFTLTNFWLPLVFHGILGLCALWCHRRAPAFSLGLLGFYLTMAPALVMVANQGEYSYRFMFLPSLGLLVAIFVPVFRRLNDASQPIRRVAVFLAGVIIVSNAFRVYRRNFDYRNDGTFFASIARDVPGSPLGYVGYGDWAQRQGYFDASLAAYQKAIAVAPEYRKSHNNLAVLLLKLGRLDEAERVLLHGVKQNPDYERLFFNLGLVADLRGDAARAERFYARAIQLSPGYAKAYQNLYNLYLRTAPDKAMEFKRRHGDLL